MNLKRSRDLATLTILAIVPVCVAACGSSSASSSTGSSSAAGSATRTANRAKLATCLKQHGVTLPTRPAGGPPPAGGGSGSGPPGGGGAGAFFGGGAGAGPGGRAANLKFRAAFQACGASAGFRGRARGGRFQLSQAAITKFASCVKQHGYTLPAPNLTGKGAVYPSAIERNAKFQSAARACQSALRPAGGAPPGGAAPGA